MPAFFDELIAHGCLPLPGGVLAAKPHAKNLGDLSFLLFRQGVIEFQRTLPFRATCGVPVSIPVASRQANAAVDFFDEVFPAQIS